MAASTAPATAAASQQGPQGPMNPEDLEAARDLLSIQTGGNGWFLITRLKEEVAAGMAAASAPAAGADGDATAGGPAGAAAAGGGGCWWGRRVSEGAFEVLGEMVVALFSAAAAQEDWRVVLAALQVSCCVSCTTAAGARRRLIGELASCPTLYCEWLWGGAFAAAVAAAYLGGTNRADLADVVAATLAEFAHVISGVGMTGHTAWLLLAQLAAQHGSHPAPPPPAVAAALRAHLAHLSALSERPGRRPAAGWRGGALACAAAEGAAGEPEAAVPPRLPPSFARLLGIHQPSTCPAGVHAGCGAGGCGWGGAPRGRHAGANPEAPPDARGAGRLQASPAPSPGCAAGQGGGGGGGGGGGCNLKGAASAALSGKPGAAAAAAADRGSFIKAGQSPGRGAAAAAAAAAIGRKGSGGRAPAAPAAGPAGLLAPGAVQSEAAHAGPVLALAASNGVVVSTSADGSLKVLQTSEGTIRLFACLSLSPGAAAAAAAPPRGPLAGSCLALARSGACGAVGNVDGASIWLLDIRGGAPAVELEGHSAPVTQLQLLPASGAPDAAGPDAALLSCSLDGRVIIWDARAGSSAGGLAAALAAPRSAPLQSVAAQGGGGPLIAAGTRDGAVLVWDVRRPDAPAAECCGHGDWVTQLAFAPPALVGACGDEGGPLLVSASADWTSRVWDAASGTCRGVHVGHAGAVTALALWDDRDDGGSDRSCGGGGGGALRVVTGCQDGGVAVWAEGGELLGLHQAHAAPVRLLAAGAGADGCGVVTGAGDLSSCLWEGAALLGCPNGAAPLRPAARLRGRRAFVAGGAMAYDPASRLLVAGGRDGTVTAWHAAAADGDGGA